MLFWGNRYLCGSRNALPSLEVQRNGKSPLRFSDRVAVRRFSSLKTLHYTELRIGVPHQETSSEEAFGLQKGRFPLQSSCHPPSCENNMKQKVLIFLLPNFIFGMFLFGFFCKRQKNLTGVFPDPTEDWLAIQNDRKGTLASLCLKNGLLKLRSKLDSHVASQLFVEHKHKFIYCEVPKVGCSNWKRTIFLLQANLSAEASEIEHEHIHQTSLIKKLVAYPPAIQKEFLNNYTKVMFTRHPLERLVSAYRDKLLHSEPFYSVTVANQIRAMFRKDKNSSEKVSFQEFVNFIVAKPPNSLDIHWKPMFLLCDPCNVHYDILGKYETLGLDSEHVLKVIGAPKSLHFPNLKRYGSEKRTNGDITLEYLRQLNSEQIEKLKKLYQMDFFLFNYTMEYEDYFSLND